MRRPWEFVKIEGRRGKGGGGSPRLLERPRMPPITSADMLACLEQAYADFINRWGQRKPTPTIVSDLGRLLFEQRIADAKAAVKGEKKPVTIFRVSTVIEEVRARRRNSVVPEKSLRGSNRL